MATVARKGQFTNIKTGYDGDAYINLAAAIIHQASNDLRNALSHNDKIEQESLERFFLGDWGQQLSAGSGEYIVETVHKEYYESLKKKKKLNGKTNARKREHRTSY